MSEREKERVRKREKERVRKREKEKGGYCYDALWSPSVKVLLRKGGKKFMGEKDVN